ncbi:MAG: L-threonine 3-dehydrogenase [Defluviitaleaceae bacterium]|nr:L-threonine 3-dehydrogenase [Defluviitaleaceae bacterium]
MEIPKTMKAIVKAKGEYGGLELQEKPVPQISKNDVLVKLRKTGICGTDVHIYKWDSWAEKTIKPPLTIGHEFVGEIVALGDNVTGFTIGQLVSGEGHVVCGKCRWCITGSQHLCRQTVGIGVNDDGVFAQYAAIPATNIWPCPAGIPENVLAVQDPLGNAVHTALSFNLLGEDVLITGSGPIGLMAVPIAKMAGARNIVITGRRDEPLALAMELGATRTVNVMKENISDVMAELGMTEGFDVGLEMSGAASAFADMVDNMANGGKIAILGIFAEEIKIDWNKVIFRCLHLKGIYGREMYDTWYKMTALLQTGLAEKVDRLVTHEFHYTDFEKGFAAMMKGEAVKVVLNWD